MLLPVSADTEKKAYLDRREFQNGEIKSSLLYATDSAIINDINEMIEQNYKPFFLKIYMDKAMLFYQKTNTALSKDYTFSQVTVKTGSNLSTKQLSDIASRLFAKYIPVSFTLNDGYSLWYQANDYDSVYVKMTEKTNFLALGKSAEDLITTIKSDPTSMPYGLNVLADNQYVTALLPMKSNQIKDAQIISIPFGDLDKLQIPEGWVAVGGDIFNNNLIILAVFL
jgi:hypothetical protein